MPGTDYVSVIKVHICGSVVPDHAGGYVPGRLAAYENQALLVLIFEGTLFCEKRSAYFMGLYFRDLGAKLFS